MNCNIMTAMHFIELVAKVRPGKENELNQAIKELIPLFNSKSDLNTQVEFNEDTGEFSLKLSNVSASKKTKEILENKNFILFLASIKVLCDRYTLIFPKDSEYLSDIVINKEGLK